MGLCPFVGRLPVLGGEFGGVDYGRVSSLLSLLLVCMHFMH